MAPVTKSAPSKRSKPTATSSASSKFRSTKSKPKLPPPKQQKTKSNTHAPIPKKKKKRVYSEKELGIPKLNMITPAGVQKPKGKKKGKVFVDDQESMMTILAMVNADKEGQIEGKMVKARQMEEIREARKKEAEARQEGRKAKLEETKDSLRKKRKRPAPSAEGVATRGKSSAGSEKKKVAFA
ncbi:MAG: 60S ribosomal subunit assembly/export protein [Chaenotheca gracillima]|nr:MAG: 60S ribosomal subunit assembly/export protein [Chaenotheca gracillima]